MPIWVLGLGLMVVLGAALVVVRRQAAAQTRTAQRVRRDAVSRELQELDARFGFVVKAVCPEGRGAVGYAERDRSLVFVRPEWSTIDAGDASGTFHAAVVAASELLDVEVVEQTFTGSDPQGQPVAVSMGVDLKVTIHNVSEPVHVVGFLGAPSRVGSPEHRAAQMAAYRWEGVVHALMSNRARVPTVNDQLQALEQAHAAGRMSDQDLKKEKAKIMARRILSRSPAPQPNRETPV